MSADWTEKAACKGQPADMFFPPPDSGPNGGKAAKALCASCDVRPECLAFALRTGQEHGVWGGLTPGERQRIHDGGTVRAKTCMRCREQFTFWWVGGRSVRTPNYCSDECRRLDRAEKRGEWKRGHGWKSPVEQTG